MIIIINLKKTRVSINGCIMRTLLTKRYIYIVYIVMNGIECLENNVT